jgi:isocitrate dehydrogenase
MATLFAWTGALRKRAELDGNDRLAAFSNLLEEVTKQTIEEGEMTGDLARITSNPNPSVLNSEEFILAIKRRLDDRIEEI